MQLVQCPTCNAQLKIPDGTAGKNAKCTRCQSIFLIPAAQTFNLLPPETVPPAAPVPSTNPPRRPSAIQAPGAGPRPPRRTSAAPARSRREPEHEERNWSVILLTVLCSMVLLGGLAVGGYFLVFRPASDPVVANNSGGTDKPPDIKKPNDNGKPGGTDKPADKDKLGLLTDQRYLPNKCEAIFVARIGQMLASPVAQKLRLEFPELDATLKKGEPFKKAFGVAIEDVDSMTVGGTSQDHVAILHLKKAYQADVVVNNKGGTALPTFQIGKHTLHAIPNGAGLPSGICLIEPHLLLVATPNTALQQVVERNADAELYPELTAALARVNSDCALTLALHSNQVKSLLSALGLAGMDSPAAQPREGSPPLPDYAILEVTLNQGISLKLNAEYKDAKASQQATAKARDLLAALKTHNDTPALAKTLLSTFQIEASATRLLAQATLEPGVVIGTIKEVDRAKLPPPLMALIKHLDSGSTASIPDPPARVLSVDIGESCLVHPGQTHRFHVRAKSGGSYKFTLSTKGITTFDLKVTSKGDVVAASPGPAPAPRHELAWKSAGEELYVVEVKNLDKVQHDCAVELTGKEPNATPPTPPKTEVVKKTGPFTDNHAFAPGDKLTYEFPVLAGQPAHIKIKPRGTGVNLDVKVLQNGMAVAQDAGTKGEFALKWSPTAAGTCSVEIVFADKMAATCFVDFQQSDGKPVLPPPAPGTVQKQGPFAENVTLFTNATMVYEFPVAANQPAAFTIKPQFDALLSVQVVQDGAMVAQENGLRGSFNLNWKPAAAGIATVRIISTDNLNNLCTVVFAQGNPAPKPPPLPPTPGAMQKNGAFNEAVNVKPKDVFVYEFPVQAGQAAVFTVKPQVDAVLDVKVVHNGQLVAVDGGLKNNFYLHWYPAAAGTASVRIFSTDNQTNNCTFAFAQGNFVQPPPAGPTVKKFGPFAGDVKTINPKVLFTYVVPVQEGLPATFTCTAQFDAQLNIVIKQKGQVVAHDLGSGIKKSFTLTWVPPATGETTVHITSTDNIANNCTFGLFQAAAPKAPDGK